MDEAACPPEPEASDAPEARAPATPAERWLLTKRIWQQRFDSLVLFLFCTGVGAGVGYVSGARGAWGYALPGAAGGGLVVAVLLAWCRNAPLHEARRAGVVVLAEALVTAKTYADKEGYRLHLGETAFDIDHEVWERTAEGQRLTARGVPRVRLLLELQQDGKLLYRAQR